VSCFRGCPALPLCLSTLVGLLATPASASADIWRYPLWIEQGLPVVEVWLGPDGPHRFVVDTGAEGSTVSAETATRLRLPLAGALEQHTMTGMVKRALVRVVGLRIGSSGPSTREVAAAVSDLRALRQVVPGVEGVLGADVLGEYDYVLDYGARSLTLARGELLSTRGGKVFPLILDRNRPLVPWPRSPFASALLLALDSSADALVMDAREAASFRCRPPSVETTILETHMGRAHAPSCELEPLRAGELEVVGLKMVEVAWPTALERRDRGLLPASAFRRVYVSASRGTLTLWPR